jgi:hypothetical protein
MGQVGGGFNDALAFMDHSKVCSAGIQVSWTLAVYRTTGIAELPDGGNKKGAACEGVAFCFTAVTNYSDSLYAIT